MELDGGESSLPPSESAVTTREFTEPIIPPHYRLAVVHEEMNSRRRNTMEDCHRVLPVLDSDLDQYAYFGVYDGHGGRQMVDFLENSLEDTIITELKQPDEAGILERMTRAFLITDMKSKTYNINTSGATAVVALLRNDNATIGSSQGKNRTLFVANVGDSRAVLVSTIKPPEEGESAFGSQQQQADALRSVADEESDGDDTDSGVKRKSKTPSAYLATRLTYDHRAEDKKEQERIKAAGGFITRNRVLGILAVSRSFGDHGMKDFVSATPYVTETKLSDCGDTAMLIIACDGVWDVFTDQEAADLLIDRYIKDGPYEDAAKVLVEAAIERGSADNVTAIVVFL